MTVIDIINLTWKNGSPYLILGTKSAKGKWNLLGNLDKYKTVLSFFSMYVQIILSYKIKDWVKDWWSQYQLSAEYTSVIRGMKDFTIYYIAWPCQLHICSLSPDQKGKNVCIWWLRSLVRLKYIISRIYNCSIK